jgi:hypothetical protein
LLLVIVLQEALFVRQLIEVRKSFETCVLNGNTLHTYYNRFHINVSIEAVKILLTKGI